MTAVSQLFDWSTARAALQAGWKVRRVGWTDQWLQMWSGGLVWLIYDAQTGDKVNRVVKNTDFGADEFAALDWTNLPATCITAGTVPGTGTNGCPLPFALPAPGSSSGATPQGSSTSGSGTSGESAHPGNGNPTLPPPATSGPGQITPGGGPGTGPGAPPWGGDPVLTLTGADATTTCHTGASTDTTVLATINFTLELTDPSGYNGPLTWRWWITNENGVKVAGLTGSIHPGNVGGSAVHVSLTNYTATPGATTHFTAHAQAVGAPNLLHSPAAPVPIKDWCDSVAITASISGRSGTTVHPTPAEESFGVMLDGNSIGAVNGAGTPIIIKARGGAPGTSHTVTIPITSWPSGSPWPGPGWDNNLTTEGVPSISVKDYSGADISPYGGQPSDGIQFVMP